MDLTTMKGIIVVVLTMVPGYLFIRTRRRFAIAEEPNDWQHATLQYLVYSIVMLAVAWITGLVPEEGLTGLLNQPNSAEVARAILKSIVRWATTVVVLPAVFGFLAAVAMRYNVTTSMMMASSRWLTGGRWRFRPLPSLINAWDAAFLFLTRTPRPILVVVTLKDKTVLAGLFDHRSVASRTATNRDLFMARCYAVDSNGNLVPVPNSEGIFIQGSEIVSMQFLKVAGVAGHEPRQEPRANPGAEAQSRHEN